MIKPRKATKADYEAIQGGMPEIEKKGPLTIVKHNYPGGEGMQIPSHEDYGEVTLEINGKPVAFNANLLREFHGKPCERESAKTGSGRYPRSGEKKE